MIKGVGTDIVYIPHFQKVLSQTKEQIIQRLFTLEEQAYAESRPALRVQTYAKRFAAKEAVAKALGTGIGDIAWTQIEVINNPKGAPSIQLYGKLAEQLSSQHGRLNIHLSLSDDGDYAQAFVIIETDDFGNEPPHPANPKSNNRP